ncbi:MAG: hypothetical protein WKG01_15325 [Kofleriaceae bacterium]
MIRNGLIALAVVAAVGTACGKDSKQAPGGGGTTTASSGDDLGYLPVASQVVAGIDVAQLQGSALWKDFVQPLIMKDAQAQIAEFQQKCGFDPMTAVKRVTVGLKNADGRNPAGVAVIHGLDKTKAMACFEKQKAELATENVEVTVDGDVVLMKKQGEVPVGLTFVKDTMAIVVIGQDATVAGVKAAAVGGSALAKSTKFSSVHDKIGSGKSIWFVVDGTTPMVAKGLSQMNIAAEAAFGSIQVTDKLAADVRLRLPSSDEATATATRLREGVGEMVSGFVEKIDFGHDDRDMKVTSTVTKAQLETLSNLLGLKRGGRAVPEQGPQ